MRIYEMFRDFGLLERMHQIEARVVTDQEILSVHTHKHLERYILIVLWAAVKI